MPNFVQRVRGVVDQMANKAGKISQSGLFRIAPQDTTHYDMDIRQNGIHAIDPTPRGTPGAEILGEQVGEISIKIPHYSPHFKVLADESQDVRAAGSLNLEPPMAPFLRKTAMARDAIDMTIEYQRAQMLTTGKVVDSKGNVLVDVWAKMGQTPKTIYFDLANINSDLRKHCRNVTRIIRRNLLGMNMRGIRVYVGSEFWDRFRSHEKYIQAVERRQDGEELRDNPDAFTFGGLVFEENPETVVKPDGSIVDTIPTGKGVAFPFGGTNFVTPVAPAPYINTVNRLGRLYNPYTKVLDNKGWYGELTSCSLSVNLRPMATVIISPDAPPAG